MDFIKFWIDLVVDIIMFVIHWWFVPATYLFIYGIAAGTWLVNYRLHNKTNGRIRIKFDSWLFFLAHPQKYHQIKKYGNAKQRTQISYSGNKRVITQKDIYYNSTGNICPIFFRAFNMTAFVWPFVLLYFSVTLFFGNIFGLLSFGECVKVDFLNDGWLNHKRVIIGKTPLFGLWKVVLPVAIIAIAILKISWLLIFFKGLGIFLLYLLPIGVVIGLVSFIIYLVRKYKKKEADETVNMIAEVVRGSKDKLCKIVEFE